MLIYFFLVKVFKVRDCCIVCTILLSGREFGISLEPNFQVIFPLLSGLTKMPLLAWANSVNCGPWMTWKVEM